MSFLDQLGLTSIAFTVAATFWRGYPGFTLQQIDQLMFMRNMAFLYVIAWVSGTIIHYLATK